MAVRSFAAPVDAVTSDARARRLVVTVMLTAIAPDQGGEPAAAPALAAASSDFEIGMRATPWLTMPYNIGYLAATIVSVWAIVNAVDRTAFAPLAVFFKRSFLVRSGLTLAIAATVTAEASGYRAFEERLWLGAAGIAFMTATIATRPRPKVEATT